MSPNKKCMNIGVRCHLKKIDDIEIYKNVYKLWLRDNTSRLRFCISLTCFEPMCDLVMSWFLKIPPCGAVWTISVEWYYSKSPQFHIFTHIVTDQLTSRLDLYFLLYQTNNDQIRCGLWSVETPVVVDWSRGLVPQFMHSDPEGAWYLVQVFAIEYNIQHGTAGEYFIIPVSVLMVPRLPAQPYSSIPSRQNDEVWL